MTPSILPAPLKLLVALLAAKKQITSPTKSAVNPHFKNKYATLEDCIEAVEPACHEQGLLVQQTLETPIDAPPVLRTILWHVASGERQDLTQNLFPSRDDNHGLAGAVTYFRRMHLKLMFHLSEADDDGNTAANLPSKPGQRVDVRQAQQAHMAPKPQQRPAPARPAAQDEPSRQVDEWPGEDQAPAQDSPPASDDYGTPPARAAARVAAAVGGKVLPTAMELESMIRESKTPADLAVVGGQIQGQVGSVELAALRSAYSARMRDLRELEAIVAAEAKRAAAKAKPAPAPAKS